MRPKLRVGIAGFGTIGRALAPHLMSRARIELSAIASGDREKAREAADAMGITAPIVPPEALCDHTDIVLECSPTSAFPAIAYPLLRAGKTLVTVSAAAILEHFDIVELADRHDARLVLATGALLGLDAVRAAALGKSIDVTMVTRKPPFSLRTARYVLDRGIELDDLKQPLMLFKGSALEGALAFPANVNVAAALALAGAGPERTSLEIWADPALVRNTHRIVVDADSARFEMFIENVPTIENPGTGRITALSMLAALDSLYIPFRIGS
jgi:aspartate dehydrogenase